MIFPDEAFDVTTFIALYKDVVKICQEAEKALVDRRWYKFLS